MHVDKSKTKKSFLSSKTNSIKDIHASLSTLPSKPQLQRQTTPLRLKHGNLENWFKSLLHCREKRKVEIKLCANFAYIIYSLITFSEGRTTSGNDISDGVIMCETLNILYPNIVNRYEFCQSNKEKIDNLKSYCNACLYSY